MSVEVGTGPVVGVDLSLSATGVAHLGAEGMTDSWTIRTKPSERLEFRLNRIAEDVTNTCLAGGSMAVLEDLPVGLRNAAAGWLGMLHGAVRVRLATFGVPFALVAPATLKKLATGKGNAPKPDLRMALYKRAGLDLADDNQVDAVWLYCAGLIRLGLSAPCGQLPADQVAALAKAQWPDNFLADRGVA